MAFKEELWVMLPDGTVLDETHRYVKAVLEARRLAPDQGEVEDFSSRVNVKSDLNVNSTSQDQIILVLSAYSGRWGRPPHTVWYD